MTKHTLNDKVIFYGCCLTLLFVAFAFIWRGPFDHVAALSLGAMGLICIAVIILFILRK